MGVGQGSVAICAQGWLLSPPPLLPYNWAPLSQSPLDTVSGFLEAGRLQLFQSCRHWISLESPSNKRNCLVNSDWGYSSNL